MVSIKGLSLSQKKRVVIKKGTEHGPRSGARGNPFGTPEEKK